MPGFSNAKKTTVPVALTTSEQNLLEAPAGGRYKVTPSVCEHAGTGTTATLRKYPSTGMTNSATNNLFTEVPVDPKETVQFENPIYLENGEILAGLAGHNSRANISFTYEIEK